jgi:hypothetical protein
MAQKASRRPPAEGRVRAQLGFVVEKAALGQTGFPRVLRFFPANITHCIVALHVSVGG